MKRIISGIMLTLLLASVLSLLFIIRPVKASEPIYIRADGSVYPPTAPISSSDNVTYTFTDNINDSIVVQRNNIVVDGAGYTVQGTGSGTGIHLHARINITITGMEIRKFLYGVYIDLSEDNSIVGNNITANSGAGILLGGSSSNSISGNNVTNSYQGIRLWRSSNNLLRSNSMANNTYNFSVEGQSLSDFVNDVDSSNTVDDKPVYYWIDETDTMVPLNTGYVALVNCTSITIQNLSLTKNEQGILLVYTTDSTITKNNIANNWDGIHLYASSNNSISWNSIVNNERGIGFDASSNYNSIVGNNITENNGDGIHFLGASTYNSIVRNNIANNGIGIDFWASSGNIISENNVTANNPYGIHLIASSDNKFYHNNFVDNIRHVEIYPPGYVNFWDDGYPSGGNYWNNYRGVDKKSGQSQNQFSSDGIGDAIFPVYGNNLDRYPLMAPFKIFDAGAWNGEPRQIHVVSNSKISGFQLNVTEKIISFNVTGLDYTLGFCKITIPNVIIQDMWHYDYTILVDGKPPSSVNIWADDTNEYIYFTYEHSEHEIVIIPEVPSILVLLLVMTLTELAVVFAKKRLPRKLL